MDLSVLILYFLLCLTSLFVIINPISTAAVFVSISEGLKKESKKEMLIESCKLAWAILIIFTLSGFLIFQLFGLTMGSFKIAGGLLLLIISLNMIFKGKDESIQDNHEKEYSSKDDLTVIPLTIPFTSGPGAITTAIVLSSQAITTYHWVALLLAITIAIILNYFVVINSEKVREIFKDRGIKVLVKLMGIIVCAVGIQFIVNGIIDIIPFILTKIII